MHTKLSNDEKIQIATLVKEVWRKTNEEEKKIFLRKLLKLTNITLVQKRV